MANKHVQGAANEAQPKSEAFLTKYRKPIFIAVAAIVIVIAGFFAYKSLFAGPREEKASTALAKGQEYFNNEIFDKALNGDGQGYAGFNTIASDYSGTDAANLAHLYAGLCYANLGKWKEAQQALDAYSPSSDAMVSPAAVAALGNVYAHLNQLDKAVSNLKKAADMADSKAADGANYSLSPIFLLQAGEILENQNKKDEALSLYQDIKKKYVISPLVQSQEIDKYIERASIK
ncbi:tetratricopeptide repeat protein [Hoylesella pleuritidis]|uniref:tetratricopeptide repeat protein n=1 Tax=Hoylesella pleuritidis TaxID=407975 RepID=UPI0028EFFE0F|nr:tetratricopeptide repeat protein [Hoylesella pleuritidis]